MSMTTTSRPRPPVEKIIVTGHRVSCDGGGGALGHPKVWYEMGSDHEVECLYCGRVFVQDTQAAGADH
jgi:uncharacterized Zn-finger protein